MKLVVMIMFVLSKELQNCSRCSWIDFQQSLRQGSEEIEVYEEIAELNIQLYDIDVAENQLIGELSHRSAGRFGNVATLVRYCNHAPIVTRFSIV